MVKNPITLKQKINKIVIMYYSCIVLRKCNYRAFSSGRVIPDESDPYVKYYLDVHRAFDSMDNEEEKEIINNDYFYDDYHGWWEKSYDRKSYLAIKRRAEKNFLRNFNEIHKHINNSSIA